MSKRIGLRHVASTQAQIKVMPKMFGGTGKTGGILTGLFSYPYFTPFKGMGGAEGYGGPYGAVLEEFAQILMPFNGKLKNFFVSLYDSPSALGGTYITLMVRKNGADTSLAVTIKGSDTEGSDETHEVTFSKGDKICLLGSGDATTDGPTFRWGCEIIKT